MSEDGKRLVAFLYSMVADKSNQLQENEDAVTTNEEWIPAKKLAELAESDLGKKYSPNYFRKIAGDLGGKNEHGRLWLFPVKKALAYLKDQPPRGRPRIYAPRVPV